MRREGDREGWVTKGARRYAPTNGNGRVTDRASVLPGKAGAQEAAAPPTQVGDPFGRLREGLRHQ